jgi:guanylate kinase
MNKVDEVIQSEANPYRELWFDYREGKLSAREMILAIDALVCSDDQLLREYEFKLPPIEPENMQSARKRLSERIKDEPQDKQKRMKKEFELEMREAYVGYYSSIEKNKLINDSNRAYMREIYNRQRDLNPVHAQKVLSVIETHQFNQQPIQRRTSW